jgi:hypothetical protein
MQLESGVTDPNDVAIDAEAALNCRTAIAESPNRDEAYAVVDTLIAAQETGVMRGDQMMNNHDNPGLKQRLYSVMQSTD